MSWRVNLYKDLYLLRKISLFTVMIFGDVKPPTLIVGDDSLQSALADMAWEMSKLEKTYVVLHLSPLTGSSA